MYIWLFSQTTCLHLSVNKITQKVMNDFNLGGWGVMMSKKKNSFSVLFRNLSGL